MTTPSKPSPMDRPWLPEGAIGKVTLDPRTVLVLHEGEGGMWTVAALAGLVKLFPEMAAMLREMMRQAKDDAGLAEELDGADPRWLGAVFRGGTGWRRIGWDHSGSHRRPVAVWTR